MGKARRARRLLRRIADRALADNPSFEQMMRQRGYERHVLPNGMIQYRPIADPPPDIGVREPRRPKPVPRSGAAAKATPKDEEIPTVLVAPGHRLSP